VTVKQVLFVVGNQKVISHNNIYKCALFRTGMKCLLDIYKNKKETIAETCGKMLDQRVSLWQLVVTVRTRAFLYCLYLLTTVLLLGDKKGILPVNNLALSIPEGSSLEEL